MGQIVTEKLTVPIGTVAAIGDDRAGLDAAAFKAKFDEAPDTIADKVNELIDELNTNMATLEDLADLVLGNISNGSIVDDMLSNTAGQIKNVVSVHVAAQNPHGTTYADVGADATGTGATEVSTHNASASPHSGKFELTGAVSTHNSAASPHTGKFAAAAHDHSGVYSPVGHDHDSDYAPISVTGGQKIANTGILTAAYDILTSDFSVLCGGTEDYNVTLPDASLCSGQLYLIQRTVGGANNIGIDSYNSQLMNGSANIVTLPTQYTLCVMVSTGTAWAYNKF